MRQCAPRLDACPRNTDQRRIMRLVLAFVVSGILLCMAVYIWHSYGQSEKATRRTTLAVMGGHVVHYAQNTGRYPDRLRQALGEGQWPSVYSVDRLRYVAAGQPYDDDPRKVLFFERSAQNYGFDRGYFVVHQLYVEFVSGEPPGDAGKSPLPKTTDEPRSQS